MKTNVKWLFQGDSITDAGRDRRNYHNMGNGYAKFASELIACANPTANIEFINLGIGGNRSDQLFDRLYPDAIALEPDVISILIGINDVWHRHGGEQIATTDEQYEVNLRTILTRLRSKTNAKIIVLSPFLLDAEDKQGWRDEVDRLIPIAKRLADKYADLFIPLDELFAKALEKQEAPLFYSDDGVHPNENGARFIAEHYANAAQSLLQSL